MENPQERVDAMLAAATTVLTEAKCHLDLTCQAFLSVQERVAAALQEHCVDGADIATATGLLPERVNELASARFSAVPKTYAEQWVNDWVSATYRAAISQSGALWTQSPDIYLSEQIVSANNIAVPAPLRASMLDTPAAQFINSETAERILVYSLQRWKGSPHIAADSAQYEWDNRGQYLVEITAHGHGRQPLPVSVLGIAPAQTYFGDGWQDPEHNRSDSEAFEYITAQLRRHYGIWPPA
ncbi:hypothetical protein [Mycobacteroides abscessus]|uniref:hypothetical protein n=1 Tax=Mycobacteroides abscessus TaxID=36809 RepID=UPI000C26BD1D|nr:hypothetical protein [Mycobacteroides abscessus]